MHWKGLNDRLVFLILITLSLVFWIWLRLPNGGNVFVFIAAIIALKLEREHPSQGKAKKFRNIFLTLLIGYVILNVLSLVLSFNEPYMDIANRGSDYFYGAVIAGAIGLGIREERDIQKFLVTLLVIFGAYYLFELLALPLGSSFKEGRFAGYWTNNQNVVAMKLLIAFSLFFGSGFTIRKNPLSLICMAGAALTGFLLFLTKTRFALLTLIFVTIPFTLFIQKKYGNKRTKIAAVVLVLFIAAPTMSYYWWNHSGRNNLMNAYRRIDTWNVTIKIAETAGWDKWIYGHGNIERIYPRLLDYYEFDEKNHSRVPHTHNVLFQTFLETGILGVVTLISLWLMIFNRLLRIWRGSGSQGNDLSVPFLAALLTIAVMGQMDYPLWHIYGSIAWLIMGLSFALIRISLQPVQNEPF